MTKNKMATVTCVQFSAQDYLRFLDYKKLIENQHDVTINFPDVELLSNNAFSSDIFFLEFNGAEKNVRSAIENALQMVTQEKKKVSFPKELQCIFEDTSWLEILNKVWKVVCETKGEKLRIVGTSSAVEQAVRDVKELISVFINSNQPLPEHCRHNSVVTIPENLSLPYNMRVSFSKIEGLPFTVKTILLSWLKKAYNYKEETATDSIATLDDSADISVVIIDDESDQSVVNCNSSVEVNNTLESSVIILETPSHDVPVIILSDDEADVEIVSSRKNLGEPIPSVNPTCRAKEDQSWNCESQESNDGNSANAGNRRKGKKRFHYTEEHEAPYLETSPAESFIPLEVTKTAEGNRTVQLEKSAQKGEVFPQKFPATYFHKHFQPQQQSSSTLEPGRFPFFSKPYPVLPMPLLPQLSSDPQGSSSKLPDTQSPVSDPSVKRVLRPVVIDGSNVAMAHGVRGKVFSCKGIEIAINWFLNRGHTNVVAFVPQMRRHRRYDTVDQDILERLAQKEQVVFTPSRRINGKCINSYDDRFIVKLAHANGGVIVSNDNFRDIMQENAEWKATIQNRLLMFVFVGDMLMIPDDPLGKDGPSLEDYLSFPASQIPATSSSSKG